MSARWTRREQFMFDLIKRLFEPESDAIDEVQPLDERFVYVALAVCATAIVLYSVYLGVLAR